jgi:hypothetical protein
VAERKDVPTTGSSGVPVPLAARTNDGAISVVTCAAPLMSTPAAPEKACSLPPGIPCIAQLSSECIMCVKGWQYERTGQSRWSTAVRRSTESFAEDGASARDARDPHGQLPAITK